MATICVERKGRIISRLNFDIELAEGYGLNEAVLISFVDEYNDTCISVGQLDTTLDLHNLSKLDICFLNYIIPFWSKSKIKRISKSCIRKYNRKKKQAALNKSQGDK